MNYDFSKFHRDCGGDLVFMGTPNGVVVICPMCQVAANIEEISGKISAADACITITGLADGKKDRTIIPDQSTHVDRGEYKL